MDLETITAMTKDIGFITPKKARRLYDFLLQTKPNHCLELGHAHGSSSCVIAAALDELGSGHLTTVDLLDAQFRDPNLEHLLSLSGLEKYVNIQREKNSYTWFLKKTIEANSTGYACQPLYDFCYIDGPKNWTIDGLAFFLVDKLLKPGGWILFDDYSWAHKWSECEETDGISNRGFGSDELEQAHIEKVFQLLVMQHPSYSEFEIQDDEWAWAHKIDLPRKEIFVHATYSVLDLGKLTGRKIGRKLFHRLFG